ncbi:MAG: ABC transporter ATP-binding protein [Firmicutes bacterium]|nr:ABC transporter ATP-binding protein [Bacillota bacterium]
MPALVAGDRPDFIVVDQLRKAYGPVTAVNGISFRVGRGEVFGLLGPNGAGKTTTLEIMEGLRRADSGRASVDGVDAATHSRQVRAMIGVQLQQAGFFEKLTVRETLHLFASFFRRALSPDLLLKRFQLEDKAGARVETISGGQKQRLSLALALLNDPVVVFLDEPTTGLDPQARRDLWAAISGLRGEGKTVILTTHYMEEAEQLCDRVAIMDHGVILAMDTPRTLIDKYAPGASLFLKQEPEAQKDAERLLKELRLAGVEKLELEKEGVTLLTRNPRDTLAALFDPARSGGFSFSGLDLRAGNLEDVFLNLTGRRLRD